MGKKYKVIGMLMTRNENRKLVGEDGWEPDHGLTMIEQWLFDAQQYLDSVVVVYNPKDNNGRFEKSDGTYEILKASKFVLDVYKNPIENIAFDGARDRERLYHMAKQFDPEWMITTDSDEIFCDSIKQVIPELMSDQKVNLWAFKEINLWRSRIMYRTDAWNKSYFPRLFRNMDGIKLWSEFNAQAIHESRIPQIPGGQVNVGEDVTGVLHYAWVDWQERVEKTQRYIKHEVDAGMRTMEDALNVYDADTNENGLERQPVKKEWKEYEFKNL